jgi:hypothetical protein
LRFDPLLAAAVGKLDPTGQDRHSHLLSVSLSLPRTTVHRVSLANTRR